MSMSKKDFIALADALKGMEVAPEVVDALVRFQKGQNYAFNESRWREYLAGECGPSGGRIAKPKAVKAFTPRTGHACSCRPGQARDNCPSCEGTGQVIDFAAIRANKGGR